MPDPDAFVIPTLLELAAWFGQHLKKMLGNGCEKKRAYPVQKANIHALAVAPNASDTSQAHAHSNFPAGHLYRSA